MCRDTGRRLNRPLLDGAAPRWPNLFLVGRRARRQDLDRYVRRGFYSEPLQRYLDTFGQNVHVVFFEEMTRDPTATLGGDFAFLGSIEPARRRASERAPATARTHHGLDHSYAVAAGSRQADRSSRLPAAPRGGIARVAGEAPDRARCPSPPRGRILVGLRGPRAHSRQAAPVVETQRVSLCPRIPSAEGLPCGSPLTMLRTAVEGPLRWRARPATNTAEIGIASHIS